MEIIPSVLQQIPESDELKTQSVNGFCYLPILYVDTKLTSIANETQYPKHCDAMEAAKKHAKSLGDKYNG
jgi:hypothetical protein